MGGGGGASRGGSIKVLGWRAEGRRILEAGERLRDVVLGTVRVVLLAFANPASL